MTFRNKKILYRKSQEDTSLMSCHRELNQKENTKQRVHETDFDLFYLYIYIYDQVTSSLVSGKHFYYHISKKTIINFPKNCQNIGPTIYSILLEKHTYV